LVKEPDLLLLDEPLSNLDARLRIETRTEIKRLQRQLGITTILVTHDQVEAMTMADRVAVMRAGLIEQLSTPIELYERPANLFVASFIGDPPMNLLPMEYRPDGGKPQLVNSHLSVSLPEAARAGLEQSSSNAVVLGVRPEDIRLVPEPVDGMPAGEVFMLERLGRATLVDVRGGQQPIRGRAPGCGSSGIGIASICLMRAPRRGWASMPTPAVPLLLGEKGVRSMSRAAVPSMPSPSEPPGVGSPPAQRVDATLSHGLSWEV